MNSRATASRWLVLALVCAGAGASALQRSPAGRPWPPAVRPAPAASPALTPEEALQTFHLPPGYRLELVASEPLVREPVALDWDLQGRLWVVEMPGWMPDITAAGEHAAIGRVVVLEDTDRDGRMDRRHVFADGLVLARSLKVLERGVLVGEPPNVWLMRDTDGDLRADTRDLVSNRYGHRDIDPQNNANGFYWALDNRLYTAGQADIHLRFRDGTLVVEETLRRGEWGVTQDDAGRIYRNTNESALHVDEVPTAYYARNPDLVRTRGSYERLATEANALNVVWPARGTPGTNRAYQTGIRREDGSLVRFTSVCAPMVYRGDGLPRELYGDVFVAEPAANLVSRLVLEETPEGVTARKAYDRGEFLASTDERFRPVYVSNAPDGRLYIADLYRGIIEHRISITTYLRDQILSRGLETPTGLGRIYRVVHDSSRLPPDAAPATGTPGDLVRLFEHPNGWWRETAQRLLLERGSRAAIPLLADRARHAADPRVRQQALWTLDGLDAIEPALVAEALTDRARDVRVAAVRIAERWMNEPDHPILETVLGALEDGDWRVRRQLAASIGSLPPRRRAEAVASLLARYGSDPIAVDAAISGIADLEPDVLGRLLASAGAATPAHEAAATMLAATIVRRGRPDELDALLRIVSDGSRPEWQRGAVLLGAEVVALGAAMPGTPPPSRVAASPGAPCPTCPGGRAGPGGAYAFPRTGPAALAGRGTRPPLRLGREPVALAQLAAGGGALGARAAALLPRLSWPGRDTAPSARALTSDEARRAESGRDVYRNMCQACHQQDGRGQDKLAPPLAGSAMVTGSPGVPIRVLLNGKEGRVGLMPPIGAALSDEQVAAVLTFIRREWGHAAAPVDADQVRAIRAAEAGRQQPWTDSELRQFESSGPGSP